MKQSQEYNLTREGYEKLLEDLQELKKKFDENELAMSRSFQNAAGDGAHDNGEFEVLQTNEKMLAGQINRLTSQIQKANIIEVPNLNSNQVNINDTVLLRIYYDIDDIEEDTYTLVGSDGNSTLNQISINSPIGKAIFQKYIGEVVQYTVNNNMYQVEILEKKLGIKR